MTRPATDPIEIAASTGSGTPERSAPPAAPPSVTSLSPAALVASAQAGDSAAFGELMRRYRPRIHALALHMCGDAHDADDIAQDSFLRAFEKLSEFRAAAEFYTWLYRIALNLSLNVKRKNGRMRKTTLDDPRVALALQIDAGDDPRRAAELRQVYTRLVAALDELSPPLRSTVVLVALQGLTHEQAGVVLACPSGTVAWRLHEARHQLTLSMKPPSRPGVVREDSGTFCFA